MIAPALRKIERELLVLVDDPDPVDRDAVRQAARRIGAQAEMLEGGVEP
jgi:hypothetical protein